MEVTHGQTLLSMEQVLRIRLSRMWLVQRIIELVLQIPVAVVVIRFQLQCSLQFNHNLQYPFLSITL